MTTHDLSPNLRAREAGMTLIEVLAVIVVVSLIATTVTVSLSGADRAAQMLKIVASIRDMDSRGRLLARTSGQASILSFDQDQVVLTMNDSEVIASIRIASDFKISLRSATGARAVIFDRQGRSEDYTLALEADTLVRKYQVCGPTGYMQESRP